MLKMFKKPLILAIVILALGVVTLYVVPLNITNYPSAGHDIIAFGDSLTYGRGSQSGGYVGALSKDLNIDIVNLGIVGQTSKQALARIASLDGYKPKVVIVLLGGNDFLQGVPLEQTEANLAEIIKSIHNRGAITLLVGLEEPRFANAHKAMFERLSRTYHTAFVPNILDGIYGVEAYMSDNLHPNDKGYRLMAERMEFILKQLLK